MKLDLVKSREARVEVRFKEIWMRCEDVSWGVKREKVEAGVMFRVV